MTQVGTTTMHTLSALDVNVFIEPLAVKSNPRKVIKQEKLAHANRRLCGNTFKGLSHFGWGLIVIPVVVCTQAFELKAV